MWNPACCRCLKSRRGGPGTGLAEGAFGEEDAFEVGGEGLRVGGVGEGDLAVDEAVFDQIVERAGEVDHAVLVRGLDDVEDAGVFGLLDALGDGGVDDHDFEGGDAATPCLMQGRSFWQTMALRLNWRLVRICFWRPASKNFEDAREGLGDGGAVEGAEDEVAGLGGVRPDWMVSVSRISPRRMTWGPGGRRSGGRRGRRGRRCRPRAG